MRRLLSVLLVCWVCSVALGQASPAAEPAETQTTMASSVPADLTSPRAAMQAFLESMMAYTEPGARPSERVRAMERGVRTLELPPGTQSFGSDFALELYQVLNKLGEIRVVAMPGRDAVEATGIESYAVFPNRELVMPTDFSQRRVMTRAYLAAEEAAPEGSIVELTRGADGSWRFSAGTVESLNELASSLESLPNLVGGPAALTPSQRVRLVFPPQLKGQRFLGLEAWQWITLLGIILVGWMLDQLVRGMLRSIWKAVMRRRGGSSDAAVLRRAVRPFGLLAAAVLWFWSLRLLGLQPSVLLVLLAAVRVFLMLASVWAAYRMTDLVCEFLAGRASETATKFDDLLVPLFRKTLKLFVTAGGLIYIADAFEIEILPLLTGLGIGGLAFAFAAKDTIENFFGSISVILDRPFEVGDWIQVDGVEGTVETVGIRSTRVRTFYNSLVTVPNSTLVRARVDNYGRRRYRRYKTVLNLTYDTPPDRIEAFCAGVRELIRLHPYTRKDYYHVWLNAFGPHSLDVLVYMFHECPDWSTELRERHRFMLDIVRLADRLGVQFAFPTQTLHLHQEEPQQPHEPAASPRAGHEMKDVSEGEDAARAVTQTSEWRQGLPKPVAFDAVRWPPPAPDEESLGEHAHET